MSLENTQGFSGSPVEQCTHEGLARSGIPRFQGRVKWFNKRRGFGFIVNVDDDTKEYFCHHSAIKPNTNCWRILHEGEYVEFGLENGKQGEQCVDVTGLRGGPLRCDLIVDKSRNRPMEMESSNENKNE